MTQAELDTLFNEAKYEEIIAGVNEEDLDKSLLPQIALSYFHTENYEKATDIFEQICKDNTDSVMWFNLCTSAIMSGNERRGLEALDNAIKYNRETRTNGEGIPTPFMLLYATRALLDSEKYNLAFNQLNELAEFYRSLSITDSHYLYTRGVPFFDEFLKLSKEVLSKQNVTDSKQWISYISSQLDENGKEALNEMSKEIKA